MGIVLWILTTPIQFWAGWQFYRGAWAALRHRTTDMNTLIAVGTSAAYLYSVGLILFPGFFRPRVSPARCTSTRPPSSSR